MFKERFEITLQALRAIKSLASSRIGCVGPLVAGFDHLATSEAQIENLFGTTVGRGHSVEEIVGLATAVPANQVKAELVQIESEGTRTAKVSDESMGRFARLNIALAELANRYHYNALAISCWSRLQEIFEVAACGAVSRLNQAGIVTSCEADVDGAIGMLIDKAMSGAPASLVDLVSLDEADLSLNIWHCGPAPRCMANPAGLNWDEHFDLGRMENQQWCGLGSGRVHAVQTRDHHGQPRLQPQPRHDGFHRRSIRQTRLSGVFRLGAQFHDAGQTTGAEGAVVRDLQQPA